MPRKGMSAWCRNHNDRAARFGHPLAPALRPGTWKVERTEVTKVFTAHPHHPGLMQALQWLQEWQARALESDHEFKGAREVARITRHGVTPLQILTELAAVVVWEAGSPHVLPDDRSRDFAASRAIFALAPRHRRALRVRGSPHGSWGRSPSGRASYSVPPRTSSLAYVGRHLRRLFAPLLANVLAAVELNRRLKADKDAAMRLPFAPAVR